MTSIAPTSVTDVKPGDILCAESPTGAPYFCLVMSVHEDADGVFLSMVGSLADPTPSCELALSGMVPMFTDPSDTIPADTVVGILAGDE